MLFNLVFCLCNRLRMCGLCQECFRNGWTVENEANQFVQMKERLGDKHKITLYLCIFCLSKGHYSDCDKKA